MNSTNTNTDSIVQRIREGDFVAVQDDANREDETDLVIAAEAITDKQMAFLIRYTSGIIAVPMKRGRLQELKLDLLTEQNTANFGTPFTMPVDLSAGTRGGVSAHERVLTIKALINIQTAPEDLGRPGHIFPLEAHAGGLAERVGHTEAALYLMEQAEMYPAAVIGELMNNDGTMMRGDALNAFLAIHSIPLVTISELREML